jgi:hypothetical protein
MMSRESLHDSHKVLSHIKLESADG